MERIYAFVLEKTSHLRKEDVEAGGGVTTSEAAQELVIQRSNCSKDLNKLVRDGRLVKLDGRPVRYADPKLFQHKPLTRHVPSYKERSNRPSPSSEAVDPLKIGKDIFAHIIGSSGSMRNAVEQAKAAILYPPNGLNCLITGPTGSGKTFFAHAMFRFAKLSQTISSEKELIVFNCADYANNPELLMSHLFGYAKGAFTGAEKEKTGIIDQADGGMLFLDEIHRLPPEGQEMIFYFMDHGAYSRLGETTKNHQASVRIIGATTEDPGSSLLDTFVRRIPINIQLPSFVQRPSLEKIDLVKVMTAHEAGQIQRKISLTEDVVKALIGSVSYGNIGQLKSNIQLVCARGFLNHMNQEEIAITANDLTDGIRSGLVQLASDREAAADIAKNLQPKLTVLPNESVLSIQTDSYELPYNLYDIIGDKATLLKGDGLDQEAINHFISTDINIHLKSFYRNHGFSFNTEDKLSEFVDQKVIDVTDQIYTMIKEEQQEDLQQNFIYAMSLHISSLLKKVYTGEERHINDNIFKMAADFPEERKLAKIIRQFLIEQFQVSIPQSEEYYLTVLLVSLRANQSSGKIGVVVAAHGNSTATSMVQVVKQLLDVENITAVDMPLEMHPKMALDRIKHAVKTIDEGSGVILLVDMGSLATFNEQIERDTGVTVRTIEMVTTSLVLETVRKASILGTELEDLYDSLRQFSGYAEIKAKKEVHKSTPYSKQAILAVCASGEGTAQRIKELIDNSLSKRQEEQLEVLTLSIADVKDNLEEIRKEYEIVAATGIADPIIQAPFIPLERFVNQSVDQVLDQLLLENELDSVEEIELDEGQAQMICIQYMEESFTFVNAKKLIHPLWKFARQVALGLSIESVDYVFYINFVMHSAGMIERLILEETLTADEQDKDAIKQNPLFFVLEKAIKELEEQVKLTVTPVEKFYLFQLIANHLKKIQ